MQRKIGKIGWIWGVSLLVWGMAAGYSARAQEEAPPPEAPAKPAPWSPVDAAGLADPLKAWGLEIHSLLGANYTYNFNEPHSGKNGLLLMNRKAAEVVGRTTRWCKTPSFLSKNGCHESHNSFEAVQFYLTYKFPLGSGLN